MSNQPNLFYISVHSDAKVYTTPYKKVIANHSLYTHTTRGRKSGRTCPANYVINKISEALMDCGAVPLKDINTRSKYSARPATFFVTQLDPYWEAAISDLAKVGVRIYVLPVFGAIEGMPDAIADSFDSYYTDKLEKYAKLAEKGTDVRDLTEVAVSLAKLFECADIVLNDKHAALIERIHSAYGTLAKQETTPTPIAPLVEAPKEAATVSETTAVADDF